MPEDNLLPIFAKAKLVPLNAEGAESDASQHITVQFNPSSLKVTLANTIKADSNGGSSSGVSAQYVDKSSSSLSIELMFDSTMDFEGVVANTDVRIQTQKIAEAFMKPVEGSDDKMLAPSRCRFQWGAFQFVGMVSSYNETLDFFSPEGIPLRAKLSLSLKEDKFQFERNEGISALRGAVPNFGKAIQNSKTQETSDTQTLNDALKKEKKDEANFRSTAMSNGIENVRQLQGQPVQVAKNDPQVMEAKQLDGSRASPGFSRGNSDTLGSRIPGAFSGINQTKNTVDRPVAVEQQREQSQRRQQISRQRINDIRDS